MAIAALFLVIAPLEFGLARVLPQLGFAFAVFSVGAGLFWLGWLGGGDVKLLAALMLWIDVADAARFFVFVAVIGGILALAVLLLRSASRRFDRAARLRRLVDSEEGLPYAVAIAGAGLLILPTSASLGG